jgi:hypothetical protein
MDATGGFQDGSLAVHCDDDIVEVTDALLSGTMVNVKEWHPHASSSIDG